MRILSVGTAIMFFLLFSTSTSAAPVGASGSLTAGNVALNLKVGVTTQAEVLEAFGSPNIVTQNGQRFEVWSYQKHAVVRQSTDNSEYFSVLIFGVGQRKRDEYETERSMTLIIKFDQNHVVSDFHSRTSEF
jgi:outer membrane protein assembly factor BamE (lipoprotein component of BamABCDE complex)